MSFFASSPSSSLNLVEYMPTQIIIKPVITTKKKTHKEQRKVEPKESHTSSRALDRNLEKEEEKVRN